MDVGDSAAIAARTLGYETLKDLQKSVIVSFVNGNGAVLPTSYGKSLCFACLLLVFDILFHPQEASMGSGVARLFTPMSLLPLGVLLRSLPQPKQYRYTGPLCAMLLHLTNYKFFPL